MSEPFLAEIRIVGFNFAPRGWAFCDGQILPISQNQSLFSLLGTTYGGDGRTSFALPDLRGRTPVHEGEGIQLGSKSGEEAHELSTAEMPAHAHRVVATTGAPSNTNAAGARLGMTGGGRRPLTPYSASTAGLVDLDPASVGSTGGQAHNNMQPYLALNFCIALQGLFPSRN